MGIKFSLEWKRGSSCKLEKRKLGNPRRIAVHQAAAIAIHTEKVRVDKRDCKGWRIPTYLKKMGNYLKITINFKILSTINEIGG